MARQSIKSGISQLAEQPALKGALGLDQFESVMVLSPCITECAGVSELKLCKKHLSFLWLTLQSMSSRSQESSGTLPFNTHPLKEAEGRVSHFFFEKHTLEAIFIFTFELNNPKVPE